MASIVAIVSDLKITNAMASAAVTGSFITYGVGQVICGIIGDKVSPTKMITVAMFGTILVLFCSNIWIITALCDWNLLLDQNGGPYHNRTAKTEGELFENKEDGCYAPILYNTEKKNLTILAHPIWSQTSAKYFETQKGNFAMEIWNTGGALNG